MRASTTCSRLATTAARSLPNPSSRPRRTLTRSGTASGHGRR
jgi:hypothetical protein